MALERTLSIVKPDGVTRNLIGEVYRRFETAGLRIVAARMMRLSQAEAEAFYAVHRERPFYRDLVRGTVVRYELPNLQAFNFLLHNALGGGGTLSLRVDHQGKTLAQGLLTMELDVPEDVLASVGA